MDSSFAFPDDVPTLTDGAVTLRAHSLSDVDAMVEQCTDPESIAWTTVPVPYAREDAVRYITEIVPAGWRNRTELGFAIDALHPDGVRRFSGSVSLRPQGRGNAEIIYGLHPAARGHGFCNRAVKLLLDWGFEEPDIEVVVWYAYVGNWASRRVAWANGFSIDGTLARFQPARGTRRDTWVGTLRADDGRAPKTAWNVPPVLRTGPLRLRPYRESDAERAGDMLVDEHSAYFSGRVKEFHDLPDGAALVLRNLEACAGGERFSWCAADPETDEMMGHLQVFNLDEPDDTTAEVSCSVHPAQHDREALTEALQAVVEWSFRPVDQGGLGKRRLTLATSGSNKRARYAAEQVGFQHVGTEPQARAVGASGFEDLVRYHRLNPHWRRRPAGR